jgi:hypothetical protein
VWITQSRLTTIPRSVKYATAPKAMTVRQTSTKEAKRRVVEDGDVACGGSGFGLLVILDPYLPVLRCSENREVCLYAEQGQLRSTLVKLALRASTENAISTLSKSPSGV